jgi:diguanylate cyclase (GGDEF)-like protein
MVLDSASASGHEQEMLEQLFGMTNAVCQPLVSIGQEVGILISANRKPDFTFVDDAKELLGVFAKQMAIAMENDILQKRAEELKVIDELTGLYNANYMKSRLEEEIRRAIRYHRPCSLVLLNVDGFRQVQDLYGGLAAEQLVKQAADLLKGQASEVDRVGRMSSDEFALILPERNKREAIELAEAVRQRIEGNSFANGPKPLGQRVTISGGVSENPLDGVNAEALLMKAQEALHKAKRDGKNKVVAC